jgi:hypothetical protein
VAGLAADLGEVVDRPDWGIRFCTLGAVTEVGTAELTELRAELEKIADGAARLAAAAGLAGRLGSLVGPLDSTTAFEARGLERIALLRALDHLRNLGYDGELMTLRGRILLTSAVEPTTYQLRPIAGGSSVGFWSFSREYEQGDRIVRNSNEEFRVVGVEQGDPTVLLVDGWRPAGVN